MKLKYNQINSWITIMKIMKKKNKCNLIAKTQTWINNQNKFRILIIVNKMINYEKKLLYFNIKNH